MEHLQPENLVRYVEILAMVIAACAAVSAATPTKIDDKIVGKLGVVYNMISAIINTAGLNVAKAKNSDVETPKEDLEEEHA